MGRHSNYTTTGQLLENDDLDAQGVADRIQLGLESTNRITHEADTYAQALARAKILLRRGYVVQIVGSKLIAGLTWSF